MEQRDLQKILLDSAICALACDGEIHEKELRELKLIVEQAQYFKGFNGRELIRGLIDTVQKDGKKFLSEYFAALDAAELTPVQVILRIVNADERIDDNEKTFVQLVRAKFRLYDEIIVQRFGHIPFLTLREQIELSESNEQMEYARILSKFNNISLETLDADKYLQGSKED